MTSSVTPSERDLRTMLDIVNADLADPPPDGLPLPVLDALYQLIPPDLLSFFGLDSSEQADLFMQDFPAEEPGGDDDGAAFWAHYWDCAPCCYPTAAATCAASRSSRTSTRRGSGTPPACTTTVSSRSGSTMS
jgi:hypothetical protein